MKKTILFLSIFLCITSINAQSLEKKAQKAWNKAEKHEQLTEEEINLVTDAVHKKYVTLDTHNDTALAINHPDRDYSVQKGQVTFEKMAEGGLDGAFFAIYLDPGPIDQHSLDSLKKVCDEELLLFSRYVKDNSSKASLAYTPEDVIRLKKEGKKAVIQTIENGYPIGWDINNVRHYYDMGVRLITLCHNGHNTICDAAMDKKDPLYGGLSSFGENVIEEMNKYGMIIDVSHASSTTLEDVLRVSKAPIIASHSGVWEIKNHKRNLTDSELKAIAAKGGTIQVATGRYFLSSLPKSEVTVKHLCDHIMHVIKIAGEDHVGIGTDFDGGGGVVGLEDVSKMKEITKELLRRGLTPTQLGKFWGGNIMRVWRDVEKNSHSLSQN